MLSSFVVTNQGFVLIVDDFGFERQSTEFLKKWLEEQKQTAEIFNEKLCLGDDKFPQEEHKNVHDKKNVILPPLSNLLLEKSAEKIFNFVNNFKKTTNIKQVFLWATTKNISENFIVPFLEYMADLTLHFIDDKSLSIITRKTGGLVTKKVFSYELTSNGFSIKKAENNFTPKEEETTIKPENLGTFKIDLNEDELIARSALKLPYERCTENIGNGKIIYTPDAADDFDDEDPDEDLYI